MLRPTKFTDLNTSVLAVSAEILKNLQKSGTLRYDELRQRVLDKRSIKAKPNFLPSLSFLFLLGKVKYIKSIDVVELEKHEN